jgi:hypothetical protein
MKITAYIISEAWTYRYFSNKEKFIKPKCVWTTYKLLVCSHLVVAQVDWLHLPHLCPHQGSGFTVFSACSVTAHYHLL